jgi:two-component system sensor histidine kinase/response regulator
MAKHDGPTSEGTGAPVAVRRRSSLPDLARRARAVRPAVIRLCAVTASRVKRIGPRLPLLKIKFVTASLGQHAQTTLGFPRSSRTLALTTLLIVAIVLLDLWLPGTTESVLFILPVLFVSRVASKRFVVFVAVSCTVLMVLGLFNDLRLFIAPHALIGSTTGMTVLWVTVATVVRRMRAEEEMALHSTALTAANNAIVITDPGGRIAWVNPAFTALTGYESREVIGQTLRVLKSGVYDRSFYERLWATIGSGQPWAGEMINRRRNGSLYTEEMTITPVGQNGIISHFIAIKQDITRRKGAEAALIEAREKLQATIAALEANNSDLNRRTQSLRKAMAAKSVFMANMSHEIRTPMNVIIGMTDMVLDTDLAVEQRHDLDRVRAAAVGLLAIINDVLDEAKIEAGKMTIELVEMDLRRTIDEALSPFQPAATTKGLSLTRTLSPDLPAQVKGDPSRIRQTLVNLVGNAIKFTAAGTITVDARVTAQAPSHVVVRVSVADSGIGIPPERQAAIFDSFVQADEGTTRRYGGTGLGLTICRDLITLMGGRMGLDSEPGRGSTFWFELTLGCPTIAAVA